ncbi:galactofuranose ABC transporter, permease protein YjfF [Burkholderia ubonensis]|uniref:galactofuranose ABC transporter, permease protein YjfF n=1 Tax=Burkholderia ubonensis TaxID=101571 RepID=UPI000B1A6242
MTRFLGRLADPRTLPIVVTIVLFAALFGFGSVMYTGFFSMQVLTGLLVDNAFLLIVAIGMTFVIVSGGIDLSVGSVVALTTIFCAVGAERLHWPVWIIVPLVLAFGALYGAAMGALIHYFRLQPFIVTLAGMFLARGACFLITTQSITINEPTFHAIAGVSVPAGGGTLSAGALVALATLLVAIYVAHFTRFGRNVYAIGGNERSALLMGLPVARTKIGVYALSGLCSALGGVVFTLYVLSGYGLQAQGMELDAIAATVIGGTLLTGGVGYVIGSVFGVGILGTIQVLITFDGTLSSWWTRIVIGALLCVFCLLQRIIERHAARRHTGGTGLGAQRRPARVESGRRALRANRDPVRRRLTIERARPQDDVVAQVGHVDLVRKAAGFDA